MEQELKSLLELLDKSRDNREIVTIENRIAHVKAQLEDIDQYKVKGLILRSGAAWCEKGEKSNAYFLNLETRNRVKKTITKLQVGDKLVTDQTEILEVQADFYKELYRTRKTSTPTEIKTYIDNTPVVSLSNEDKASLEGMITFEESWKAIKTFTKNKSPGNDGLTIEFYEKFWPLLGTSLVEAFNFSYEAGELSTSQKQAVIKLLDKGKDRLQLKNWRPISLLNVDYKIASKALAMRLAKVRPKSKIHNQVGYVKGRTITENIRAVEDILEYTKRQNKEGLMICIDFQKAFDSLEWDFLRLTLEKMNFGKSFV